MAARDAARLRLDVLVHRRLDQALHLTRLTSGKVLEVKLVHPDAQETVLDFNLKGLCTAKHDFYKVDSGSFHFGALLFGYYGG